MPKFRKKPVVIEAMQFDGSWQSAQPILAWIDEHKPIDQSGALWSDTRTGHPTPYMTIYTLEGPMTVSPGDWIIRGIAGELGRHHG